MNKGQDILRPERGMLVPGRPDQVPGLVSFWRFEVTGSRFVAEQGSPCCLCSRAGALEVVEAPSSGFGGKALRIQEGEWLSIARSDCPELDFHGRMPFTVVAWIRRARTRTPQCEFIAGQWNETNLGRQYGLFLNIRVWGQPDRVFGHLSANGGPTPGYRYCMDGCMGGTPVPYGEWVAVAMSYDGHAGYAWLNGLLDGLSPVNPYPLPGGVHDSGPAGSDFTVGAVDRSGEIGNFFCGDLAGLAVYRRALTPAEMFGLCARGLPA